MNLRVYLIIQIMKRIILLICLVIAALFETAAQSQNDCKVLLPSISSLYEGSCKKGLADGEGEAYGIDHYKGEFRKGFPDGDGTYIWKTGEMYSGEWKKGFREGKGEYTYKYMGKDTVISGIWKEDKYIGEKAIVPYVIEYKNSISRVTCVRIGSRPYVKYKFSRGTVYSLLMQGSSGTESNTESFCGHDQVSFPFKGKITFTAPQAFMGASMMCELRFIINEPGSWEITVFY